jgi:SAM-dependent methyltransferase
MTSLAKWPKFIPPLTPEQAAIADDFMKFWHDEILPKRYGFVEAFNHRYPAERAPARYLRTLEIGAGLGEHIKHETLTPEQECNYVALELRQNMADAIKSRFPRVVTQVGNVEAGLDYPDGHFDRVIAIHVLEHLPDLPNALAEIRRLLDKEAGQLAVVIPCEGGLGYALARKVSSQRVFERRYNSPYKWFIEREHVNTAREVLAELERGFVVRHRRFFPLLLPAIDLNLNIGLTLSPRG